MEINHSSTKIGSILTHCLLFPDGIRAKGKRVGKEGEREKGEFSSKGKRRRKSGKECSGSKRDWSEKSRRSDCVHFSGGEGRMKDAGKERMKDAGKERMRSEREGEGERKRERRCAERALIHSLLISSTITGSLSKSGITLRPWISRDTFSPWKKVEKDWKEEYAN